MWWTSNEFGCYTVWGVITDVKEESYCDSRKSGYQHLDVKSLIPGLNSSFVLPTTKTGWWESTKCLWLQLDRSSRSIRLFHPQYLKFVKDILLLRLQLKTVFSITYFSSSSYNIETIVLFRTGDFLRCCGWNKRIGSLEGIQAICTRYSSHLWLACLCLLMSYIFCTFLGEPSVIWGRNIVDSSIHEGSTQRSDPPNPLICEYY